MAQAHTTAIEMLFYDGKKVLVISGGSGKSFILTS
jgi:hypothetical protein